MGALLLISAIIIALVWEKIKFFAVDRECRRRWPDLFKDK